MLVHERRTMGQQVTVALAHHHVTSTRHGGHHMTRFDRQDLIAVTVEEEQRFAT